MPHLFKLRKLVNRRNQIETVAFSPLPLPLEVWELILEELSDEELRTGACVCRAFNDRCVAIYLRRHDITPELLARGALAIFSPLLSILQLARLTPQIDTLVCRFWPFHVLRDMKYLRQLIHRSHGIKELRLSFASNLTGAHTTDTIFPYPAHTLLNEFCDVIRALATRTPGLTVVCVDGKIYRVRPGDLAGWGARYFPNYYSHFFSHIAWMDKARFKRKPHNAEPHILLRIWCPGWGQEFKEIGSWLDLTPLLSIRIRAICPANGSDPFTLIIFNHEHTSRLCLGAPYRSEAHIPNSGLAEIIPHLTLPSLSTLEIVEDTDPTLLCGFLIRHPTIQTVHYRLIERKKTKEPAPSLPARGGQHMQRVLLTCVPFALPSLHTLSCENPVQMIPLLDSFGTSPRLRSLDIAYKRYTALQVAALKLALRHLSLGTKRISLVISTRWNFKKNVPLPIDDEERRIVGCLYCIARVKLSADNMSDVQALIPWVAMLPALAGLKLYVGDLPYRMDNTPAAVSARAAAMEVVRAALPWVPLIRFFSM